MLGTIIDNKGWRQGSVLKKDDVRDYLPVADIKHLAGCEIVGVVITQSCDLIHHCFDAEPNLEILVGKVVNNINGNYTFGKHPRLLHVQLQHLDTSNQIIEFLPQDKIVVERTLLHDIDPDVERYLPEKDLRGLILWLAARYDRPAFPNAFNSRIQNSRKSRDKNAKKISKHVIGLYIDINPDKEIAESETYNVTLIAVVERKFNGDLSDIETTIKAIADDLRTCNMNVTAKVMMENRAPFTLLTEFKRFDYDYLSLKKAPTDPMVSR